MCNVFNLIQAIGVLTILTTLSSRAAAIGGGHRYPHPDVFISHDRRGAVHLSPQPPVFCSAL